MTDKMVLRTQQWLNQTYGGDSRFNKVAEDGQTGWSTIYGLTRALQIELGIQNTADNFGPSTQRLFVQRYPNGVQEQKSGDTATSNVYSIIQGALWCKGYSAGSDEITQHFYGGTGKAIKNLKTDMGIGGDSSVDVDIMGALLSMKQFVLLESYGGLNAIRQAQQQINGNYRDYTGIIPTDGLYGREMNTALIQVLQAIEGFTPSEATGNFGSGTKSRLKTISASNGTGDNPQWVWLATVTLVCNRIAAVIRTSWHTGLSDQVTDFQRQYGLPQNGTVDPTTWMSLLTSKGDPNRPCVACDTRFEITDARLATLKANGYQIVGRYLTEPGQSSLAPADYFKAIRPGELERITKGGMKFFPIFQEYSTKLAHFTPRTVLLMPSRHVKRRSGWASRRRISILPWTSTPLTTKSPVTSCRISGRFWLISEVDIRSVFTHPVTSALALSRPVMRVMRSCPTCPPGSPAIWGSRSQIIGYMTSSLKSVVIRDKAGILTALPIPAKCLLYPM